MQLEDAFDALLSDDNEIEKQANDFLIEQIYNNPTFYISIIEFYSSTDVPHYRKSSLSVLQKIVVNNFRLDQQNLQDFGGKITNLIQNSQEIIEQRALADIIFQIAIVMKENINFKDHLEYFCEYLIFYRTQNNTIPFCIYLYALLTHDKYFSLRYREFLKKITPEIILNGIQYNDIEIQIKSVGIFCKVSKKIDDDFINTYQEHIDIINQKAENSLEINEVNEDYFYNFWSYLCKADREISVPLFEAAHSILHSEKLSSKNRNILYKFIILRSELIKTDFIEDIITNYFNIQFELEDLEASNFIMVNLIKVDKKRSYELFKREFLKYLKEKDIKKIVCLHLLPYFFLIYKKETINDISEMLRISIDSEIEDEKYLLKSLFFLENFLHENEFNTADSILVFDFLVNVMRKYKDDNIQFKVLKVCKNLNNNHIFFEKMIGIFENIGPESYAVYFSILIFLYKIESSINMDKYQPFLTKLIEIFNEYNQKVDEINNQLKEDPENLDILEELYKYTLIQGSSGNLILYLWYFNPIQLDKYVKIALENFLNIIKDEYFLCDDDFSYFNLNNIKDDFAEIVKYIKGPTIEFINKNIHQIANCYNMEQLQHFMCSYLDPKNEFALGFIDAFNTEVDNMEQNKMDTENIVSVLLLEFYPMSKWIYKITDNLKVHRKYLVFIRMLIQPYTVSFDVCKLMSKILLRIVKPKRIEFNRKNQWYSGAIKVAQIVAEKMIEIIPEITPTNLCHYFDGFANLVLLFVYTKNDKGHLFLNDFLIPFYFENQETTETEMIDLFSKLIKLEYCNDEEIEKIIEILKNIIERGKIYQEIEMHLFDLMTNLVKIRHIISPLFIDFAIEIFNDNINDESQIDLNAYCAHFLLSSLNRKPEEFEKKIMPLISEILIVFPISEKHETVQFWLEIKSFIEKYKDKMTEKIYESLFNFMVK